MKDKGFLGRWRPSRSRRLTDPYYRFQSLEEVQIAAKQGVRIDVNQASVDDWLRLPGLSIHQARTLVELARSGVAFHCTDDVAAALSVPVRSLRPLEPILQFCYYDAESVSTFQTVNPNTASIELLLQVPAIDLSLAQAIVQNRQQQGAYRSLSQFQQRLGLAGTLTAEIMHYLRF
jgi:DNA uptake protein ComE-like DNA-binding protein